MNVQLCTCGRGSSVVERRTDDRVLGSNSTGATSEMLDTLFTPYCQCPSDVKLP